MEVDGDTSPDTPTFGALLGIILRCSGGASVIVSSCGGDVLCMDLLLAASCAVISEVDGLLGRFFSKVEEESRDWTAKAKKSTVLLLTLSVHLYSDNLVR